MNKFKELMGVIKLSGEALLNKNEWAMLRKGFDRSLNPRTRKKRRFSYALIQEEKAQLKRFREVYREIMKILSKNKNNFTNIEKLVRHQYLMEKDEDLKDSEVKSVLAQIKKWKATPLEVGQKYKVLAVHPKTGNLSTGTILTSSIVSAHIQFDREDLGVWVVKGKIKNNC